MAARLFSLLIDTSGSVGRGHGDKKFSIAIPCPYMRCRGAYGRPFTTPQVTTSERVVAFKATETVATRLAEQAAQIRKVSAQLDVSKTAPQIVLNNQ